jgi:hypothetical protein
MPFSRRLSGIFYSAKRTLRPPTRAFSSAFFGLPWTFYHAVLPCRQLLIAEHVELEKKASNGDQHGLHHFADYLHAELDRLASDAVMSAAYFARAENSWIRFESALGSAMTSF